MLFSGYYKIKLSAQRPFKVAVLFLSLFFCHTIIAKDFTANDVEIKQGDWILRQGTSTDSRVILKLTGSQYSHIGVVIETKPQVIIVHATTDDNPNLQNQVIVSTLENFLSPELAKQFAIVRPKFLTALQQQQVIGLLKNEIGKPFIIAARRYPHRYCTTIIEQAIKSVYAEFSPHWQQVEMAFFAGEYLFPESFLNYPNTQIIYQSSN